MDHAGEPSEEGEEEIEPERAATASADEDSEWREEDGEDEEAQVRLRAVSTRFARGTAGENRDIRRSPWWERSAVAYRFPCLLDGEEEGTVRRSRAVVVVVVVVDCAIVGRNEEKWKARQGQTWA